MPTDVANDIPNSHPSRGGSCPETQPSCQMWPHDASRNVRISQPTERYLSTCLRCFSSKLTTVLLFACTSAHSTSLLRHAHKCATNDLQILLPFFEVNNCPTKSPTSIIRRPVYAVERVSTTKTTSFPQYIFIQHIIIYHIIHTIIYIVAHRFVNLVSKGEPAAATKAVEGHSRLLKAVEGHSMLWKAIQCCGRPFKAVEGHWRP